jgi:hypothetical protein
LRTLCNEASQILISEGSSSNAGCDCVLWDGSWFAPTQNTDFTQDTIYLYISCTITDLNYVTYNLHIILSSIFSLLLKK